MESWLRNALCVVLLLGCLRAMPVKKGTFNLLEKDVHCKPHVNFTSPTTVLDHCRGAALTHMEEQLKTAKTRCTDKHRRIDQALEAFAKIPRSSPPSNSSECQWENEGSQKLFQPFLKDIKNLIKSMNNAAAAKADRSPQQQI